MNPSLLHRLIQKISLIYPTAKRWLHSFHGGVFPQYNKSLSSRQPIRDCIIPDRLILPLQQQVGHPAELLVKVGSYVQKNQLIARSPKDANKALVVPVHAPTSGIVEAIEPHFLPHVSGLKAMSILIKTDQKHTAIDNALKVDGSLPTTPQAIKDILFNAGIIGMGGAGFPTYAKLPREKGKVHTLLINGAECEPFITCDDLLMQSRADEVVQGALMVAEALGATKILCGIESNKPLAIQAMRTAAQETIVEIVVVQTVYPMGGKNQLTLELTGIEMPRKVHAVDFGLLMMNVATYAAIYRAVKFGEPLTSRLVTVSGLGLSKPFNIQALIGTPFSVLANAAQPKVEINYPLVMGGPMMGFQVQNNEVPVIKTTNCILANPPEPVEMQMPCIRCGECMDACPVNLLPQQMYWHSQAHEFDKVEKLNVADCIECGCCSYVCPSHIPLVQYYRHAKAEIKTLHAEAKMAEIAKQRHDFRLERLEREKQEREARLQAKKDAVKKQAAEKLAVANTNVSAESTVAKKPSAAAMAARAAAARRAAKANTSTPTASSNPASTADQVSSETKIPAARLKAIEAAKKASEAAGSEKNPKTAAKNAAMAAAKKRALDKKASNKQVDRDSVNNLNQTPKVAAQQAAMAAAKKRAQTKKTENVKSSSPAQPQTTELKAATTTTSPALEKEAARKAAIAAERDAVKTQRMLEATQASQDVAEKKQQEMTTDVESPATEPSVDQSAKEKRLKAMEVARERAAERQAKKQQESS